MVLDVISRKHTNPKRMNKRKPMKWILLDSLIIGGIAACAAMPSSIPSLNEFWVLTKAFLGSFLFQLAIERGIKRD